MADIHLLPFGSAGDVLPFIWLGRHLMARGHRVTLITSCLFEEQARLTGLRFVPVGTTQEFETLMRDPRLWRPVSGTKLVFDCAAAYVPAFADALQAAGPCDLMLAPVTTFAARIAREKTRTPLITVHLQPAAVLSAEEPPLLHPLIRLLRPLPVSLRRILLQGCSLVDLLVMPALRRHCAAQGVNPPRGFMQEWWDSPDGVLALFPDWFAAPQADWPQPLLQWTFPLEDLAAEQPPKPELQAFLDVGERPIVFTPGSANVQASRFFAIAASAVQRLGCRAVFVTREPEQVPPDLPSHILTVDYAPFSTLLRHASVFVHHGGVGTLSQGFAAGVPQLVMPMAHDQPDNAQRAVRLGAGLALDHRRFTVDRATRALRRLLNEPAFKQAAMQCAERLARTHDVEVLMRWLEHRCRR